MKLHIPLKLEISKDNSFIINCAILSEMLRIVKIIINPLIKESNVNIEMVFSPLSLKLNFKIMIMKISNKNNLLGE